MESECKMEYPFDEYPSKNSDWREAVREHKKILAAHIKTQQELARAYGLLIACSKILVRDFKVFDEMNKQISDFIMDTAIRDFPSNKGENKSE